MIKANNIKKLSTASKVKIKSCNNKIKIINISSKLTFKDIIGSWKARWGINRMNFKVSPGLYSIGTPDETSPVLVTANYKMSFDSLRKELKGINAYILVLDTKGINVWCSASKGTFGTDELVRRITKVSLTDFVSHRTVILPQLSATGVSAHEVQRRSGFRVIYGPVKAADIPAFLNNQLKATEEMRRVSFNFIDRIVLTPIEIVGSAKVTLQVLGVMFLLNLLGLGRFTGLEVISYLGAVLTGCLVMPMVLPWIPARAFSLKGWLLGLLWTAMTIGYNNLIDSNILTAIAYLLILPSVSSYYSLNFTGSSTFTSFSGVLKETKTAIPIIFITIILGIIILLGGSFIIINH
ncbi:MAG: acetyl-CoA synthase subunit gamma [Clostridiaceae bacterium]|jgi:hypothetical protein|nr:acetyl-CoA synthase subunit gamma [Clostridiaceae bacterium]